MVLIFHAVAVALTVVLCVLYVYGVEVSFFWIYPLYDSLLHALGGLVMGFWASAVAMRLSLPPARTFLLVGGVALAGAVGWEAFEYTFDLIGDLADTLSDLALGIAGAFAAGAVCLAFRRARP